MDNKVADVPTGLHDPSCDLIRKCDTRGFVADVDSERLHELGVGAKFREQLIGRLAESEQFEKVVCRAEIDRTKGKVYL